jgi:AmmeMemoRadiSam system protein B/AmmeMemoRadiSam system protein A
MKTRTLGLVFVLASLGIAPCVPATAARVRPAALAGTWYPESPAIVATAAHVLIRSAAAAPRLEAKPVALVVPHAGWQYSGVAAGAAFRNLRPGDFARVVVVGPSHHGLFDGYALDDATAYRTPLGEIPLCTDALARLRDEKLARVVPDVTRPEHAVEIELPFLQATLGRFCLVPVLAGRTDAVAEKAFAERLAALNDGATLFVFSSDFTHYGPRFEYTPFGPSALTVGRKIRELDDKAIALLSKGDAPGFRAFLAETGATICGRAGLSTMLELLPRIAPEAHATLLAHYASADLPSARDVSSVDYAALAFTRGAASSARPLEAPPTPAEVAVDAPVTPPELGARLTRLARAALETELSGKTDLLGELQGYPEGAGFETLQAAFVTLYRTDPAEVRSLGRLRGCIGQVEPTYPLYLAVVTAAREAALSDPRFPPVTGGELRKLEIEVTVLSRPRPIGSWKEIQLGRHGIVLEKSGRRALFLPQVPTELGWNLEETLSALSQKAGLAGDAWRSGATFQVFTGSVFEEKKAHGGAGGGGR